ncbi:heat shock 70 kDa protein 12A-like [Salarias fasciatus]|uniref:Heat shock 70 kDa protein 12A-like n=1 Tax=Salarias fasciatus TaxID=181472 RepID=A0A672J2M7_SALFA|nr:heat shock 70 kDa protein 12A-like [Salarias fasciatus]
MSDSFIVAIDFGTSYSGFAFSMTSREEDIDPYLPPWGEEVGLETPKTPTCILFDEHQQFVSFGYEAKVSYVKMRGDDARKKFFFECFKMSLYGKKLSSDLTIRAANGKCMKALKVFTEALRYLKDSALKTINNTSGRKFIASDFNWVLTVPAIWDPSAKQFMRKAATQAGIVTKGNESKLIIALEPEAASIWCKKLPADGFTARSQGDNTLEQSPGTQYIVVDCGGGTVDITVHEVLDGGDLKELHKASGNNMGGQTVDQKFKELLKTIFCDGVWEEYERQYPSEVQKMMYDFTLFKKKDQEVEISCPYNLGKLAQEVKDVEAFFQTVSGASWNEGSIQISREKLRSFFKESLNGITASVREMLKKDLNIEYLLLVGGYAESQILQQHIISQFSGQCKVLCPFRAQEAIVKGAVLFGRTPEVVASRQSAFTYGLAVGNRFDASKHRADKKYTNKDGEWCHDIFMKLVAINENVAWDDTREHTLTPSGSDHSTIDFAFYCTEKESPFYVDEDGVEKIGSFVVSSPDTRLGMKREIKLKLKFGFTEVLATATDVESGSTESVELDFMRKL